MGEQGQVIDIKNGLAVISFKRTEACAKCKACMAGFMESQMILEASNNLGAKTGDTVIIELVDNAFLKASAVMYGIPLAMMMAGFFAGRFISVPLNANADILAFFIGITLMVMSFIIIRLFEKKIKSHKAFLPYVAKIVEN